VTTNFGVPCKISPRTSGMKSLACGEKDEVKPQDLRKMEAPFKFTAGYAKALIVTMASARLGCSRRSLSSLIALNGLPESSLTLKGELVAGDDAVVGRPRLVVDGDLVLDKVDLVSLHSIGFHLSYCPPTDSSLAGNWADMSLWPEAGLSMWGLAEQRMPSAESNLLTSPYLFLNCPVELKKGFIHASIRLYLAGDPEKGPSALADSAAERSLESHRRRSAVWGMEVAQAARP
ncbi:hypothetical protein U1Q18_045202, partial [Sarracenia purpurea var. burkii]